MEPLQLVLACHITGIYDVNRSTTLPDDSYELVQEWAESVENINLRGIIFHNNFSDETCTRYENEHISFVRIDYNPQFNPNVFRYFVYRDYLAKCTESIQGVFVTDVSDVTLAQNPFIHPLFTSSPTSLFCGDEPKPLLNDWMLAHGEHLRSQIPDYADYEERFASETLLNKWQLQSQDYYLIVGRMIPDNNSDIIIEGFINSSSTKKLVIVGDVPYQDAYATKIKSYQDDRLVFTGYITNGDELASLYKYCFAYMHGHEFGGTNPTLLKAMANGCAIGAIDTVFSREVLQNDQFGTYFKKDIYALSNWFQWAEANTEKLSALRLIVSNGLNEKYDWDLVTDLYLYHLKALVNKKRAE